MGKENLLTAVTVSKAKTPGMLFDGGGLYLQVTSATGRSWVYRYTLQGKPRWLGLGPVDAVSLAQARLLRDEARLKVKGGIDPVEARKEEKAGRQRARLLSATFKEATETYIAAHEAGWRNPKHRQQWRNTLAAYAYPTVGELPAASVTASHVVEILRPIWAAKPETARRLRGRIEAILDYAADPDDLAYRNPAALTAQLRGKLPKLPAAKRAKSHAALSYSEMADFMATLRARESIGARALEFLILTAARTNEVLQAKWTEIDEEKATWTIPAERMKAGREHRIPLSVASLDVLRGMQAIRQNNFVFAGAKRGKPMSNMTLLVALRRLGRADVTAHGFRATFRTWAAELTNFPKEIAEAALAHVVKDKTEAAYQRGDLFEKRRRLMDAWAEFCAKPVAPGSVVPFRAAAGEG